jgi:hypothetical protein
MAPVLSPPIASSSINRRCRPRRADRWRPVGELRQPRRGVVLLGAHGRQPVEQATHDALDADGALACQSSSPGCHGWRSPRERTTRELGGRLEVGAAVDGERSNSRRSTQVASGPGYLGPADDETGTWQPRAAPTGSVATRHVPRRRPPRARTSRPACPGERPAFCGDERDDRKGLRADHDRTPSHDDLERTAAGGPERGVSRDRHRVTVPRLGRVP